MLPSPDEIRSLPSKPRPLPVDPWVLAELSRLWQSMKRDLERTTGADTEGQPRSGQSKPASSRNRS